MSNQIQPNFDVLQQYQNYKNVLKNAVQGEVVTRFPPEPSGYLHVGHIKAALLNYHYSQIYQGKMILRFDDTNPSNEKDEFVQSIYEDLKTLGINYNVVTHTSDHFEKLQIYMSQMIEKGQAYCDNTLVDQMRLERGEGIESQCRNNSVEQNQKIWLEILAGSEIGQKYCVRAKIDMLQKNKCMRDPVFYRVNLTPHHRTGIKYKAYPTYDFCCPIVDSIEGVTHALRTNEYADRNEQFHWVQNILGLRIVTIYDFSRLNLKFTCLSKRKLQWFVDTGKVEGWYDPRFPTVRGILRRGLKVQTLTEFMLQQGPSKSTNLMEWDKLWALNNKIIDPVSPRYTAISKDKICQIHLLNGPEEIQAVTVPQHQKNPQLNDRILFQSKNMFLEYEDAITVVEGEKITLMKWGNAYVRKIQKNEDQTLIIDVELAVEDKDFKNTKKFGWLSKESPLVPVYLVEYDHLINIAKIEETTIFEDVVNTKNKFITEAIADSNIKNFSQGQILQFERRGFFILDQFVKNDQGQLIPEFVLIPDGKVKSMSGLSTKVDAAKSAGKEQIQEKVKEVINQDGDQPLSKKQLKKLAEQQKKEQQKLKQAEQKQQVEQIEQIEKDKQ